MLLCEACRHSTTFQVEQIMPDILRDATITGGARQALTAYNAFQRVARRCDFALLFSLFSFLLSAFSRMASHGLVS